MFALILKLALTAALLLSFVPAAEAGDPLGEIRDYVEYCIEGTHGGMVCYIYPCNGTGIPGECQPKAMVQWVKDNIPPL